MPIGERKGGARTELRIRGGFFSLTSQELNIGFCPTRTSVGVSSAKLQGRLVSVEPEVPRPQLKEDGE
jgi:hypothetical protein